MEKGRTIGEERFQYKKDEIDKYIRETEEFTKESILDYICEDEKDEEKLIEPYVGSYLNRLLKKPLNSIERTGINLETGEVFYEQTELAKKLSLRI